MALDEPYTYEPTYVSFQEIGEGLEYPVTVPEGHIFVLGDNRNGSSDSRYAPIGMVDERDVLGKVLCILLPRRRRGHREAGLEQNRRCFLNGSGKSEYPVVSGPHDENPAADGRGPEAGGRGL